MFDLVLTSAGTSSSYDINDNMLITVIGIVIVMIIFIIIIIIIIMILIIK